MHRVIVKYKNSLSSAGDMLFFVYPEEKINCIIQSIIQKIFISDNA